MKELRSIELRFKREGVETCVTFAHPSTPLPNPATKRRLNSATRMATEGLRLALSQLESGAPLWGGYETNERITTDTLLCEREGGT